MDPEKLKISETTDGKPPREGFENAPAPAPIDPDTGQHQAYWVLSAAERSKGFVRPVRRSYRHVGIRPKHPLRDLTEEEKENYKSKNYVKYEEYPLSPDSSLCGRFWTQSDLESGCGGVTTMGYALAETYARDPGYYGETFCATCEGHFRVGRDSQFIWVEGGKDTNERVGT